jgi:putative sporulation protein YyaC
MENQNYTFSTFNEYAPTGISLALKSINNKNKTPIILCIGSDLVLSDSLGPLIGTFLLRKNINAYVYGSLTNPVTAKEVNYAKDYLSKTHNDCPVIAVDAAVGKEDDVGLIRVLNKGIKPGLGVGKNLKTVGDLSIIGIVAEKNKENKLLNVTRLNLIYTMAEQIAKGIEEYLSA